MFKWLRSFLYGPRYPLYEAQNEPEELDEGDYIDDDCCCPECDDVETEHDCVDQEPIHTNCYIPPKPAPEPINAATGQPRTKLTGRFAGGPFGLDSGDPYNEMNRFRDYVQLMYNGDMDEFLPFFYEGEKKIEARLREQHEIAWAAAEENTDRWRQFVLSNDDVMPPPQTNWEKVLTDSGTVASLDNDVEIVLHERLRPFINKFNQCKKDGREMVRCDDPRRIAIGFYLPEVKECHLVKRNLLSFGTRAKSVKDYQKEFLDKLPEAHNGQEGKLDRYVADEEIFETTSRHELGAGRIGFLTYNVPPLPSVRGGPGSLVDTTRRYAVAWLDTRSFKKELITYTAEEFTQLMKKDHVRISDGEKLVDTSHTRPA